MPVRGQVVVRVHAAVGPAHHEGVDRAGPAESGHQVARALGPGAGSPVELAHLRQAAGDTREATAEESAEPVDSMRECLLDLKREWGAAAVVVSNHRGRQLDSVASTLRALPEIASAVNGQIEVLMDGGIRRGSDIVKAICLGARAVLIGRGYAYGLAAAGKPGVVKALDILKTDVERTLRLLGCPSISALDRSYVDLPHAWECRCRQ